MRRALLLTALALAACATPLPEFGEEPEPLQAVGYVDVDRYMGRWYVIANIPYFAEHGNLAPYVEYSRRPDGLIDDKYTAQERFDGPPFTKDGMIEITNPITQSEGRITFLPPLWQDYAVLFLDDGYRYSMIGHPNREYLWLFAREPRISAETYGAMLAVARVNGYNVSRIQKIPHRPEDLGAPGFQ
ncbi:MAG: lipocalin family protein [Burkholderiales bacterium]